MGARLRRVECLRLLKTCYALLCHLWYESKDFANEIYDIKYVFLVICAILDILYLTDSFEDPWHKIWQIEKFWSELRNTQVSGKGSEFFASDFSVFFFFLSYSGKNKSRDTEGGRWVTAVIKIESVKDLY